MKAQNPRFELLRKQLNLADLDQEAGFFVLANLSEVEVSASDGPSPASNAIYYALNKEQPQNHLHHLFSDDYHILIEGGPADYFVFHPDKRVEKFTLGREVELNQRLMVTTPGGCAKAIRLHDTADYLLVGSVVTPAWKPDRITIGAGQSFIDAYAGTAEWATPEFLISLIGPNWRD